MQRTPELCTSGTLKIHSSYFYKPFASWCSPLNPLTYYMHHQSTLYKNANLIGGEVPYPGRYQPTLLHLKQCAYTILYHIYCKKHKRYAATPFNYRVNRSIKSSKTDIHYIRSCLNLIEKNCYRLFFPVSYGDHGEFYYESRPKTIFKLPANSL
jgi:hypothetical protein